MSTTYYWYSHAPDLFGHEICQNLKHWEVSLDTVISYCRENLDARVVIDEYRVVYTGRKFLEVIGVEEGDGAGVRLCEEVGCRALATHPPHEPRRTYPLHEERECVYCSRWCATHAKDVA